MDFGMMVGAQIPTGIAYAQIVATEWVSVKTYKALNGENCAVALTGS